MLRSIYELFGYLVKANDGDIGSLHDILLDEKQNTVRYFVVDKGNWLPGRKVLLSPTGTEHPDWANRQITVSQTKEEIEDSPSIDEEAPVSRKKEVELFRYFQWDPYWTYTGYEYGIPAGENLKATQTEHVSHENEDTEVGLRSIRELEGYTVHAADEKLGGVKDFIVDDETWDIRYLVADTSFWPFSRQVLLSTDWIETIRWENQTMTLDLTSSSIESAPEFNPFEPVNRELEERVYDYYGRPAYWASDYTHS